MNAMRRRMVDSVIGRFLSTTFEQTDKDAYTDVLTVMEKFEDFKEQHARSYVIESSEVLKKINLVFPNAIVSETKVFGITKKPPKPGKVRREFTDEEWREMQWRTTMDFKWERWIDSLPVDRKTEPFKVEWFANDVQHYHMGAFLYPLCSECSVEDATKYLSSLEYLYFDQSDNMWHFHNREVPSF